MNKVPFITKEQAEEIAGRFPTPFYIYDESGIRQRAKAVKDAFAWNPGFREYFAVKATPNPYIMRIMQDYDFGFDCSSEAELLLSDAVGADGAHIMFSSNETPAREYALCHKLGGIINLDDITHIPFLARIIGPDFPETMSCRYNPGGVFQLANGIMDNPGDSKYGMTREQLFEAYRQLQQHGVKNFGLHAFLASNTVTNDYYPELAAQLFQLAVEIHQKLGIHFAFINLSGGVGIAYRPDQEPNDIAAIGEGVHRKFDEILVPAGMGDVAIYTEMGRYMLAPYGALVTRAIHAKHIYKEYIGVDACAANLMRPAMYGAYHHITVLGKEQAPCDHKYDIVGSLCENNDKFAVDRMLPEIRTSAEAENDSFLDNNMENNRPAGTGAERSGELLNQPQNEAQGDLLYIHDAGAHGFSMGYNYNGRLWCAELLLHEDGTVQQIRRAETIQDYFATFDQTEFAAKLCHSDS